MWGGHLGRVRRSPKVYSNMRAIIKLERALYPFFVDLGAREPRHHNLATLGKNMDETSITTIFVGVRPGKKYCKFGPVTAKGYRF